MIWFCIFLHNLKGLLQFRPTSKNCIRLWEVLCNCTVTLITSPPSPSRPLQMNFSAVPLQPFHSVSIVKRPIRLCPTSAALCVTPQPFKAHFFRQRLLHHFQLSHSIFHLSLNLRCSSFSEPETFSSHPALFTVSQKLQHPEDLDPTLPFPYFYLRTYVLPYQTRHTENTNLDIDARPAVMWQLENSLRWRYRVSETYQPWARLNRYSGEVDLWLWKQIWDYWTYNLAIVHLNPLTTIKKRWLKCPYYAILKVPNWSQ